MRPFNILIIDDEPDWVETFVEVLQTQKMPNLTNSDYQEVEFVHKLSPESALQAVAECDFDLILLDLVFPDPYSGRMELSAQGMDCLPKLRRWQPDAAIIILTSYKDSLQLNEVVTAIRDGQANDFLSKTDDTEKIFARMRSACLHQLKKREEDAQNQFRAHAAITYAEDVGLLLSQTGVALSRLAQRIEGSNPTEAAALRQHMQSLKREFDKLTEGVSQSENQCVEVDIAEQINQVLRLNQQRIKQLQAVLHWPDAQKHVLNTYKGDLRVALHQVISNALTALEQAGRLTGTGEIDIALKREDDEVVIRVVNNGNTLSTEALQHLFEPSNATDEEASTTNQTTSFYVVRRMMHHLGGRIEVRNRTDGEQGTEVQLRLRDLG